MSKILILANSSGGLYNFRFELIERLIRDGHRIFFTVPNSLENEKVQLLIKANAEYIQIKMNRRGINPLQELRLIKEYRTIIKEKDPDLILTYTIKPNIYGTYVASRYGKPVIMNITGIGSSLSNGGFGVNIIKR